MSKVIKHYGTKRHSGRYPWGSGGHSQQGDQDFLSRVYGLRKEGLSDTDIAKGLGMTTSQLRAQITIQNEARRQANVATALKLKDKGMSNVAIGRQMGINESSVRALLKPAMQTRMNITETTANMLKDAVNKKGYIDVGVGTELSLGISRTKLKAALQQVQDEGYKVHYIQVEQAGTGKKTTVMTLAKPDTPWAEVNKNKHNIQLIEDYHTNDGGRSYFGLKPIQSVDSKRIEVNYAETGGTDKDGVIEIRRGLPDLDLGNKNYAQVRIGVDGTHYLKGMVMYADDLPPGVDIRFNTNKSNVKSKHDVLKKMTDDPDNPFGASIKAGGQKGALNIVNEEGDWAGWSKNLSSQFLSKQRPALIKKQLDLAYDIKKSEYDEIMALTNPTIKKKLLESYADDLDAASVHLKAAAMPRQASHVLLPFPKMKENEIYAPNYRDGEKVALVRYPHGGTFEIPVVTVNNKQSAIQKLIGRPKDAVGIHPKVAGQLSGADFDGDTVLVIPTNGKTIKTSSPLKGLKDFDPQQAYPGYKGMPAMKSRTKQTEMGKVSNLITDMTVMGASESELARAVRHSMVVIDAEKHKLNYKQSYVDNGIGELKKKYQGAERAGARTLISRASSEKRVAERKELSKPDPKTGRKLYKETGATYINKDGKEVKRTTKTTKLGDTQDAHTLSSGTIQETIYANYSNKLKSLANQTRKDALQVKARPYSPSAKQTYSKEVSSLKAKLNIALKNAPRERQAQLLANQIVRLKKQDSPDMPNDKLKKIKGQAIQEARLRVGANKKRVEITSKEWEAIQAGAISNNTLSKILNNTDLDTVRQLATPRQKVTVSKAKLNKAKAMKETGYTQSEIADAIGVSTSKLNDIFDEGGK